jgi:2-oxo-4-hydroxy-4-carboxy-5-ureidoimidazoline decarboxylase
MADLEALDRAAFIRALGFVFEHSPWVVERAFSARPFRTFDDLHRATVRVLEAASPAERLALIRAHPELAGRAAVAGELTEASRGEQARAGLGQLSAADFARFHALNAAYGSRFGFPFIICARLNDKASILVAMQRRLDNDAETEVAEAIAQIGQIARFRLLDAVED